MHKEHHRTVLSLGNHHQEIPKIFREIQPVGELMKSSVEVMHPRLNRKPMMGTCCIMTTACVKDDQEMKCIFNSCAISKEYENCMECHHWSNHSDPCHLEKVSRNYCPAILRHKDLTI